jgi:hypothetical protein
VVDDSVPDELACEVPVLVLEPVEPADVEEVGCVVEPPALGGGAAWGVVDAVEGTVEVVVEGDPPVGLLTSVRLATGVAPPRLIIVDVPPVARDFTLAGTVAVVVEVVTVVGPAADGAGATGVIRVCGCNAGTATACAACSDEPVVESVFRAAAGRVSWWLGGAISGARAW